MAVEGTLEKIKFFEACDGMLHGSMWGETFGLAVAEFSVRNKPVITCLSCGALGHVEILREKAIYYNDETSLHDLLTSIGTHGLPRPPIGGWDAYSQEYSPLPVMSRFYQQFL